MLGTQTLGLNKGWTNCHFAHGGSLRALRANRIGSRRACVARRRNVKLVRSEMGGEYGENFDDVTKHMTDLFTYKAVRQILSQLKETDPGAYRWLYDFTVENKPSNSVAYCSLLVKENYELGERILAARVRLLADWMEKLPTRKENILLGVKDSNLDILRGLVKDSVNFNFTAKPRPDVDE